jgi:hypothetical protein
MDKIPCLFYDLNSLPLECLGDIYNMLKEKFPNIIIIPRETDLVYLKKEELINIIESLTAYAEDL